VPDSPFGPDEFAAATGVSRETMQRLEAYAALLVAWSARINLVGRATLGDLWRRHFLDSAQLQPLIPAGARSLVDLGSGAGFPGLVLALLGVPGVELVEAEIASIAGANDMVIEVLPFDILSIDFARKVGASMIVRGLRAVKDADEIEALLAAGHPLSALRRDRGTLRSTLILLAALKSGNSHYALPIRTAGQPIFNFPARQEFVRSLALRIRSGDTQAARNIRMRYDWGLQHMRKEQGPYGFRIQKFVWHA